MNTETVSTLWNSTSLVGKDFSHYQVLLKIQQTDLFTIYKAFDTALDRKIALQVFSSQYHYTQDFITRLKKHIEVLQDLSHPNIASMLEVASTDNLLYLVLDFVPKISFAQRYNQQLEAASAANVLIPVAEALAACHQAGIVHGNLNPDCLYIDENNHIQLCDFGMEQLTIAYLSQKFPGNWLGFAKHAYLAPERILQQLPTSRSDTYALGVMFAELISGKKAFMESSILESYFHRLLARMDFMGIETDAIPPQARKMIRKATSLFPQRRYSAASAFLEALEMVRAGHWKRAERERKQPGQNRKKWWIAAASLLLLGILAGYFVSREKFPASMIQAEAVSTATQVSTLTPIPQPTKPNPPPLPVENLPAVEPSPTALPEVEKLPVIFNQPMPDIREEISPANVQQIVPLARWGLGSVRRLVWSPDNQQFTLGTSIGAFSFDTSLNFQRYYDTTGWANAVAYSPDGQTLITGTRDGLIKIWATNQEDYLPLGGHIQAINSLAFSPDGSLVASGAEDHTVKIWDVKSKQVLHSLENHLKAVQVVAFSPDGQLLASGSTDNTIKIWGVTSGEQQMNLALSGSVTSLAFSPNGKILAAVGGERLVRFWDMDTGQPLRPLLGMVSPVMSISFHPDSSQIAVGELNGTVSVWEVQSQKSVWIGKNESMPLSLGTDFEYVHEVAFSPDGAFLASASWDNTVVLFDVQTGQEIRKMDGFGEFNQNLAFSPDSRLLAIQSLNGNTKIWDVSKGEVSHIVTGYLVQGRSFSTDSQYLALKANSTTVHVYNTTTGELKYTLSGHRKISGITFSQNDLFLAAGSGQDFKVWSMNTGLEVMTTPTVYAGCTFSTAVSGTQLATGTSLNYLGFNNPEALCKISRPPWAKSMDISYPLVAFGGTSMIKIENFSGESELTSIMGFDALCLDLSENRSMILAGVSDKSVRIWELESLEEILNLTVHESPPTAVQFSPDNQMIATIALDGTVYIWGIH